MQSIDACGGTSCHGDAVTAGAIQHYSMGDGAVFNDRETKPSQLIMIRADGSEKRNLTSGPLNSGFPSWSPDGKRIVYRVWAKEERSLQILNLSDGKEHKAHGRKRQLPCVVAAR